MSNEQMEVGEHEEAIEAQERKRERESFGGAKQSGQAWHLQ